MVYSMEHLSLQQFDQLTANAKDSEVIKKSSWILGHSPEKLKYVPLKLAQMEIFSLGKSEKNISN